MIHLLSVWFQLSGHLTVVRWQIQGLEETSQEEVCERRQPDGGAMVSCHHLIIQACRAAWRHTCRTVLGVCLLTGKPDRQHSWGSVGTFTHIHVRAIQHFYKCEPRCSLYIKLVPLAACSEPNNRSWTKRKCEWTSSQRWLEEEVKPRGKESITKSRLSFLKSP